MGFLRPTNGFDRKGDAELSQSCSFIIAKIAANPVSFPTPDPSLAEMQATLDSFTAAVKLALTRSSDAINAKNGKREALIELLHLEQYYILYASKGNRTIAESSGFKFAKDPSPQGDIDKPTDLQVINSNQTGAMHLSIKKVKRARVYVYQYTTDPELKTWTTVNSTQRKCTIAGLTPGTLYYWRVGAIGAKGQTMYSDVMSRMAA